MTYVEIDVLPLETGQFATAQASKGIQFRSRPKSSGNLSRIA